MDDRIEKLKERFENLQKDLINNCRNEYGILLNRQEVEVLLELLNKK